MKELSSAEIRQMFLDFFASKGHEIVPSKNLIPVDDPTLLWINSGVATLKNILMVQSYQRIHALRMRKKRFEQMILKMLVKQHDIIHCLK